MTVIGTEFYLNGYMGDCTVYLPSLVILEHSGEVISDTNLLIESRGFTKEVEKYMTHIGEVEFTIYSEGRAFTIRGHAIPESFNTTRIVNAEMIDKYEI